MAAQGAELKLRVSLDLTTLRRQLNSINTELGGQGITVPIKLGSFQDWIILTNALTRIIFCLIRMT
jgi:hypothetical protein